MEQDNERAWIYIVLRSKNTNKSVIICNVLHLKFL